MPASVRTRTRLSLLPLAAGLALTVGEAAAAPRVTKPAKARGSARARPAASRPTTTKATAKPKPRGKSGTGQGPGATPSSAKSAAKPRPPRPSLRKFDRTKPYRLTKCALNTEFLIGRGIYDITGPAAESQLMGYANAEQQSEGIHTRLWSRAFIIESPCNDSRLVYVAADLGMMFQSVKQGVVAKLKKKYGNRYTEDNVMLSATHTHHGPAGYAHYALYNVTGELTRAGFDKRNYDTIVDGIYKSIVRAHLSRTKGTIKLNGGDVASAGKNRSMVAYNKNPDRGQYSTSTDRRMTLLRFDKANGQPYAMLNWFAVHPTNFSKDNRLITGDNKGIAAWRFERDYGTKYTAASTFVGAFANANEGDVSPNLWGVPNGSHDASRARTIAGRQYNKAKALFASAKTPLVGGVSVVQRKIDFSNQTVGHAFTGAGTKKTCPAALGISFAAGSTEDGPGEDELLFQKIYEGMTYNGKNRIVLPGTPSAWLAQLQPCHAEKDILMPVGKKHWLGNPYPWTPQVLPVQLARIGKLAIAAVPFECTTMCGRRIRSTILDVLGPTGVTEVVIAGLSNGYAGYVTTRQEYAAQHYEGASTHFGPWTLAALRQEFSRQAKALHGQPLSAGAHAPNLAGVQIENSGPGVVFDDTPVGKSFGDVATQPKLSYARGSNARAVFWGGHPKNNYKIQQTFLVVQRYNGSKWVTVARDTDDNTSYRWKRSGVANSKVTVDWKIPSNAQPGTYRIRHSGHYKNGWTHKIHAYLGTSRSFLVN